MMSIPKLEECIHFDLWKAQKVSRFLITVPSPYGPVLDPEGMRYFRPSNIGGKSECICPVLKRSERILIEFLKILMRRRCRDYYQLVGFNHGLHALSFQ